MTKVSEFSSQYSEVLKIGKFQPSVAYKSVAYKKSVEWSHKRGSDMFHVSVCLGLVPLNPYPSPIVIIIISIYVTNPGVDRSLGPRFRQGRKCRNGAAKTREGVESAII